jgi:hypothetical protein
MEAAIDESGSAAPTVKQKFTLPPPAVATTLSKPADDKADCGCDVMPWDDCVHTSKS